MQRSIAVSLLACSLAACGGGSAATVRTLNTPSGPNTGKSGSVTVTIIVPRATKANQLRPITCAFSCLRDEMPSF